jgi:hypothetical protein
MEQPKSRDFSRIYQIPVDALPHHKEFGPILRWQRDVFSVRDWKRFPVSQMHLKRAKRRAISHFFKVRDGHYKVMVHRPRIFSNKHSEAFPRNVVDDGLFSLAGFCAANMLVEQGVETQLEAAVSAAAAGNWREAHEKLEQLSPERTTPEALLTRCRSSAKAERWGEVEMIASAATNTYPDEAPFYTQWAWALYRQERKVEAFEIIDRAAERFSKSVAVAYSAACLHGAMNRPSDAKRWLARAIERASNPEKVKLRSLVQPELQCVWTEGKVE